MVKFGIATHNFVSDATRPLYDQVEETAALIREMGKLGTFDTVRAQHHWLSHPTVWIEPFPLLARLAAEAPNMRLMTSVIKPPIHNPIELAHQVATLDQISNGRFILGIGSGYQVEELEAVGATRKERAARVEESLELMKLLWSGEEVTYEGKFWTVHNVRMGYTCVQQPHVPIWNASYSVAATRRAARACDGIIIAPQASWEAVKGHADSYREALVEFGKTTGMVGANRNIVVAPTYEEADRAARDAVVKSAAYYGKWGMNEASTIDMVLDPERDPRDWSIVGTPDDCVEQLQRHCDDIGLEFIGAGLVNMPHDPSARLEHIQYVSETVLSKFL
jgi:alkanesulfonate monooxygenase SsuD/methylene tetrahydromethanopterin reductase-like flavin-dependent oxidoreductase (luciferase family)